MRSQKELSLDTVTRFGLSGKAAGAVKLALGDDDVQAVQEYANRPRLSHPLTILYSILS